MRFSFFASLITSLTIPLIATAQECISHTTEVGAVYGEAEFIGEPWNYTWTVEQVWDNELGDWVAIEPIIHSLPVPGEAIQIRFEDGSEFIYGTDLSYHAKGDNFSTLYQYGYGNEDGPYQAVRTTEGEVFLLDESRCEQVSWDLAYH